LSTVAETESRHSTAGKTKGTFVEVYTPRGVQIVNVLFWLGGLSGVALGILVINQGFFEISSDLQFLLYLEGVPLAVLGAAMFVAATGLTSGASWSMYAAKRLSAIMILWSAIGAGVAAYLSANMSGIDFAPTLYGIVAWMLIFGIGGGTVTLFYLSRYGTSVRRYAKYVTQEVITPESTDARVTTVEVPLPRTSVVTVRRPVAVLRPFCWHCGSVLLMSDQVCPKCGANRETDSDYVWR
jgi:hypothetical protein